jgi:catechol 2,3-dioxygenase-like lactoylglutathione lyase family enzyme
LGETRARESTGESLVVRSRGCASALTGESDRPQRHIAAITNRPEEVTVSGIGISADRSEAVPDVGAIDMKLEVVTLPVSDVDRAKRFYQSLGWRLDNDVSIGDGVRGVQFTPPRSECSITIGTGLTTTAPGSVQRLELVVSDIEAARADLIRRGVEVSELFHRGDSGLLPGQDPERRSYLTYASFSDPDGNGWLLQEVTSRPPSRVWDD